MVYVYTISTATPPVVAYANMIYDTSASLTMMGYSVSGTVISGALYVFSGGPQGNSAYGVLYVFYCATPSTAIGSCTKQYTTFSESYNFVGTAVAALPTVAMGVIAAPRSGSGSKYYSAFWPCTYTTSATTVGNEVSMPYASSSAVAVAVVSGPIVVVGEKDTSAVYVYYCTSNTACSSYLTISGTASTDFGYSVSAVLVNGEIYVAIGAPAAPTKCTLFIFFYI